MVTKQCVAKKSFTKWFDPENMEHIKAYHHLQKTGNWPIGFKPENIWIEPGWQGILAFKLANKWVDYKMMGQLP